MPATFHHSHIAMFVLQLPVLSQIITDLILDWSEYSNAKTRNEAFRTCRSTQLTAGTHFTLTPSTLHLSCVATKDHGLGVLHCRRGLWGARGMQVWGKASSGTFNINLRASSTQKALTLAFFFFSPRDIVFAKRTGQHGCHPQPQHRSPPSTLCFMQWCLPDKL